MQKCSPSKDRPAAVLGEGWAKYLSSHFHLVPFIPVRKEPLYEVLQFLPMEKRAPGRSVTLSLGDLDHAASSQPLTQTTFYLANA